VELIDLDDDKKVCPDLPEYPIAGALLTAAFHQGKVVACGGEPLTDQCFELGPDLKEWRQILPLPEKKYGIASSIIDNKWILSGGFRNLLSLLSFDGGFTIEPQLPFEKEAHCQVTVNSTHIFFAGGVGPNYDKTFMLDISKQEWIYLESINMGAYAPACGLINNAAFGPEILYAAGTRSFIFSLTDLVWKEGPPLPEDLYFVASAQLTDGILAIGGLDSAIANAFDKVYKFDENIYDWLLEKERLAIPRGAAAAVAVPNDFLGCQ